MSHAVSHHVACGSQCSMSCRRLINGGHVLHTCQHLRKPLRPWLSKNKPGSLHDTRIHRDSSESRAQRGWFVGHLVTTTRDLIPTCTISVTATFAGDGIYEPFEPEMDYNKFGIKLREADIPVMHKILESVGEEEYARKQVGIKCKF
eukprot:1153699-Pelagomonas_calceolata.AAC.9